MDKQFSSKLDLLLLVVLSFFPETVEFFNELPDLFSLMDLVLNNTVFAKVLTDFLAAALVFLWNLIFFFLFLGFFPGDKHSSALGLMYSLYYSFKWST